MSNLHSTVTTLLLHHLRREIGDQNGLDMAATSNPGQSASITNPFPSLRLQARLFMYPRIPRSTCLQLFILSGIYALICLTALASLGVGIKRKNLALIDKYASTKSEYLFWVPRWTVVFPASIALFSGLVQGYIWTVIAIDRDTKDQTGFVLWQTIVWLPLWFAGYSLLWHILFTADMSRLAASHFPDTSNSSTAYVRIPGVARWLPTPLITNTIFWLMPVLVILFTMTPFGFANTAYDHVFYAWQDLDRVLQQADQTFNGIIQPSTSRDIIDLHNVMSEEKDETIRLVRAGYIVYSIIGWLLCMAAFLILGVMTRVLKRQISALQAASMREQAGEIPPMRPSFEERHRAMRAYMRSFLLIVGAVFFVTGLYTVISISIAIQPTTSNGDSSKSATSSRMLAGLWIFAVVGGLATVTVLYHACYAPLVAEQVDTPSLSRSGSLKQNSEKRVISRSGPKPLMIGRPIPTVQESGIFRVFRDANSLQNDVIPEDYEPDDEEKRVQFRL